MVNLMNKQNQEVSSKAIFYIEAINRSKRLKHLGYINKTENLDQLFLYFKQNFDTKNLLLSCSTLEKQSEHSCESAASQGQHLNSQVRFHLSPNHLQCVLVLNKKSHKGTLTKEDYLNSLEDSMLSLYWD